MTTHSIAPCAPRMHGGMYRSLCGSLVRDTDHSDNPTCAECARLNAEDEAATSMVMAMHQTPPENPVRSTLGDPTAGYEPRGARQKRDRELRERDIRRRREFRAAKTDPRRT